jgi:hypothetical protein
MLGKTVIPKSSLRLLRTFAASTEITNFVGFKKRNFIPTLEYTEVFNAVLGADSVSDMADFLRSADGAYDDKMLSFAWKRIRQGNFQLDESFKAKYVPLTIQYIRSMKRDNVDAFTDILVSAGQLGV